MTLPLVDELTTVEIEEILRRAAQLVSRDPDHLTRFREIMLQEANRQAREAKWRAAR